MSATATGVAAPGATGQNEVGLRIRGLQKSFGGLAVASDIDLDLRPGDRTALIGPNGAGKTTISNLITGIIAPSAGEIRLDGRDIRPLSEAQRVKAGIAKTFQITTLFRRFSARETLRLALLERERRTNSLFSRADGDPAIEAEAQALLEQFDLAPLADIPVQDLAYGQQRLVEIALTLALKPRILILDEPAAGIPSGDTHLVVEAIARLPADLSVLIIEHDMDLVFDVAQSIVVLVGGAILTQGPPAAIAADERVRELYLGKRDC